MTTYPVMEKRHLVLVRRVEPEDIRIEYLAAVDAASLAGEPRKGVEEWIDQEVRQLESKMHLGDQLYFYRYEKCCGWYREGYVAVRGECIVGEINTREDM